jgi:TusA-related sulfurtransferase
VSGNDEKLRFLTSYDAIKIGDNVKHVLDLRGLIIPLTLLKITQGVRNMSGGETMEIIGTDPDTRKDMLRILGFSPCKVLSVRDEDDRYFVLLKKNERPKDGGDVQKK